MGFKKWFLELFLTQIIFNEQFKKDMNDTESKNKPSIYLYINNDRNLGSIIWPG